MEPFRHITEPCDSSTLSIALTSAISDKMCTQALSFTSNVGTIPPIPRALNIVLTDLDLSERRPLGMMPTSFRRPPKMT